MIAEIPRLLVALAALVAAEAQEPAASSPERVQVRATRMIGADGSSVDDGALVIEGGRIARVGRGADLDPNLPILEHDGVLTAGIVVCQTHSGAAGEVYDAARSVLPEARLVHAFDPRHSDFEKALEAGITSMVIAPSDQNLAGGITAVVKTTGEVLKEEGHLALSFSGRSLAGGVTSFNLFFEAEEESAVPAAQDGGLENTEVSGRGSRYPTSYPGALEELGRLFGDPRGAFARAAHGELPVLIEAMDRSEVVRALAFAKERGLKGAVRGAPLAAELVPRFKESGLGAILGPYSVGHKRRSLESLAKLAEAGVPVAFALDAPAHDPEELRLSAAMTLGAGAESAQAWRALTVDAARIAGVDERVGSLEPGKDADFVLWSGDPLDLSSRVVAVYIGGQLVYDGAEEE